MVTLRKLALVIGTTVAVGLSASAQTTTSTGTSTGSTSSTGSSGSSSSSSTLGDSSLAAPPTISALSSTSSNTSTLNSSNAFSYYYANPYYQGKAGSTSATAPGGFGAALYGTSGTTTSNAFSANSTGRTTSTTGRTTGNTTTMGAGNTTTGLNANRGQTGFGNTGSNTSGIVVQLPRQIAYTSTLNFQAPVVTMPQMQQNLRVSLDRSTMLTNPRGIELTMDGNVVVLKGNVATEDEQRLVEGMIRLTPGVRDVRNELKVPGSTPAP